MNLLIILILIFLSGLFLYWQLVIAEGAYMGARVVALLYDWTAHQYNDIKQFDETFEMEALGMPLINLNEPLLLDVATGTGRVPLMLLQQPQFTGQVIGVDRAAKMLAVAQADLAPVADEKRVLLVQADAMALPFADNSMPLVSSLEVLEFLPHPEQGLHELVRVLAPESESKPHQGWLLISNRIGWEAWLMPGKTWSRAQLQALLHKLPLHHVDIRPWQMIYDLVWAQKTSR